MGLGLKTVDRSARRAILARVLIGHGRFGRRDGLDLAGPDSGLRRAFITSPRDLGLRVYGPTAITGVLAHGPFDGPVGTTVDLTKRGSGRPY